MKKIFLGLLAVALSACTLPTIQATQAPAPLAATTVDDKALSAAWKAFDVALDAIDLAIDAGAIKPGSPKAVAIADAVDKVVKFLTAAEHAAAAGSTTDYLTAIAEARAALAELRSALRS